MRELEFTVRQREDDGWGLELNGFMFYCGDLLGDIDTFLGNINEGILKDGDKIKIIIV